MEEEYRDIKGYEGMYQVSNLGNVKSLKRLIKRKKFGDYWINDKILRSRINKYGYKMVNLCDNDTKKMKTYGIHVLVAMSFMSHIPNGNKIVVDHIDNNDRLNNRVDNLQLITHRLNASKDRKGTSEYTGVCWDKSRNKWLSTIRINSKYHNLGRFDTEYEAHLAYQKELKKNSKR